MDYPKYLYVERFCGSFFTCLELQVIRRMSLLYQVPMDDLLDKYNTFLMNGQGEQMKRWRMNLGYSCKTMGKYLGVATSNIVVWEKIMTRKL